MGTSFPLTIDDVMFSGIRENLKWRKENWKQIGGGGGGGGAMFWPSFVYYLPVGLPC